ncbi:MAG TPA: MlaD family protein [Spirochaetia bacterium]|nr:MlaD family protein [Spirochaetia bacterium]
MKLKIRFAEQIVGSFLLVAILGVVALLVLIGVNQRWFARNYLFTSRFASADGLAVGMPIMLKGFEIGKITRISLNEQDEVDIQFLVEDTYYDRIRPNSVLQLVSSPIGLGTSLKFIPGKDAAPPLPEMAFVPTVDSDEGKALVAAGLVVLPKGEDVIGTVISKINPVLDDARDTIVQIRRLVDSANLAFSGKGGPVGTMVSDLSGTPARVNQAVTDASTRINDLLDRVSEVSDSAQKIATHTDATIQQLSDNLETITDNLKEMSAELKNTQGLAKRLLDPKGSVDTLLNDQNQLYDQIDQAVKGVDGIVTQIKGFVDFVNGSRPEISSILEKGRTTLDNTNDVLQAAKNNPLLKGGVPPAPVQSSPTQGYRDEDF